MPLSEKDIYVFHLEYESPIGWIYLIQILISILRSWVQIHPPGSLFPVMELRY